MSAHADRPRLLLIDNYDSFTYNLVQAFLVLGADVRVHRNDEITVEAAREIEPTHLCISPGPGVPSEAGVSEDMIRAFAGQIPVLGVCLGHQALVRGLRRVDRARRAADARQGVAGPSPRDGLLRGVAESLSRGPLSFAHREARRVPDTFEVTAWTAEGEVMGVRHRTLALEGVQFHPESILTPDGPRLLAAFLNVGGTE